MFDERRVKNKDRSASHYWPEIAPAPRAKRVALPQSRHSHQPVTFAVHRVIPLSAQEQRQTGTSRRAKVLLALSVLSRQEFLLPYCRAGRYASQEEYAQICLQR